MKATISLRLRPSRAEFLVFFSYSNEDVRDALQGAGIRYEAAARGYVLSADPDSMARARAACQKRGITLQTPAGFLAEPLLPSPQKALLARYCECLLRERYNPQTIKNYRTAFSLFLNHHAPRLPLELDKQDVLDYLSKRDAAGISKAYQNLLINAIKFYYQAIEGQPDYAIPRPKRLQIDPKLLTKVEVRALIQGTENRKHRAMLMLAYGLGLCLNEVLALTPSDIDSQRMVLCIRGGKGKKDRHLPLPSTLMILLREQSQQFCPVAYLFEGMHPGTPYSARSLQQVVQQAAARASIQRPITLHMLRHSYAAHLVDAGTDIHLLQDLLGHTSIKSTGIYTQRTKRTPIASPLDDWA